MVGPADPMGVYQSTASVYRWEQKEGSFWQKMQDLNQPRFGHRSIIQSGRAILHIGGYSGTSEVEPVDDNT